MRAIARLASVALMALMVAGPVLAEPPLPKAPAAPDPVRSGPFYLQTGAFRDSASAEALRRRLATFGQTAVMKTSDATGVLYQVTVGPFAAMRDTEAVKVRMEKAGFKTVVITKPH